MVRLPYLWLWAHAGTAKQCLAGLSRTRHVGHIAHGQPGVQKVQSARPAEGARARCWLVRFPSAQQSRYFPVSECANSEVCPQVGDARQVLQIYRRPS